MAKLDQLQTYMCATAKVAGENFSGEPAQGWQGRTRTRVAAAPCVGSPEKFSSEQSRTTQVAVTQGYHQPACRRTRRRTEEKFSGEPAKGRRGQRQARHRHRRSSTCKAGVYLKLGNKLGNELGNKLGNKKCPESLLGRQIGE